MRPAARDPRAHGAYGRVRDRRDLAVAEAPEIAEEHCLALFVGELPERCFEQMGVSPLDDGRRNSGLRRHRIARLHDPELRARMHSP